MKTFYLLLFCLGPGMLFANPSSRSKLAEAHTEYKSAEARKDTIAMAEAAYLLGKRYRSAGDAASGRRWILHSLRLREPKGSSPDLNKIYVQLALSSLSVSNYGEAYRYAHKALANSRKIDHLHSLMSSYHLLSGLHWRGTQALDRTVKEAFSCSADSAHYYANLAEAIAQQLRNPIELAYIRTSQGVMIRQENPRRSITLLRYSLAVQESTESPYNIANLHCELAASHRLLNELSVAHKHLSTAEKIVKKHQLIDPDLHWILHRGWADWHRESGQWQAAFQHLSFADSLYRILQSREQMAAVAQLNVVYETDKRNALIKASKAELALRDVRFDERQRMTYGVSSLLMLTAGAGFVFFQLNTRNKRISQQNAHLVQEQSHRMKNYLQSVSALLSLQSKQIRDDEARQAVEESQLRVQTMALLNRQLYQGEQLITLGLPVFFPELVRSILDSYGFKEIQPMYELDDVPVHVDQAIPLALIMSELVTNACKYAFPHHPDPQLTVRCWRQYRKLHLQVEDNGPGFTRKPAEVTGFGMRLIDLQVRQLWGHSHFSDPPGVTFTLTVDIKE